MVLSDIHVPFHDKRVFAQALNLIEALRPDGIVVNGDVADMYEVSRFDKNPKRKLTLQDECDAVRDVLADIRRVAQNAWMRKTVGNHEDRLNRYLWSRAPELSSLRCLDLRELFGLDELGVELHGIDGFQLRPGFRVVHGSVVRQHAGHSAKAEMDKRGVSGISGHTHRLGMHIVTNEAGTRTWVEGGCLCLTDAEYVSGTPNWQQGLVVLECVGNDVRPELARVHGRRMNKELVFRGESYK